jgi:hypothetical protein
MDSLIAAAGRALSAGDALGALDRVALRSDPPALALRGIAMAQLGEHGRARELLRRAARAFGAHEQVSRARCVVAEAEVALLMRDLRGSAGGLTAAIRILEAHADRANALQARVISARRLLLLGRLNEAASLLNRFDARGLPATLCALAELTVAELALRFLQMGPARSALARAQAAADRAQVPALLAEVAEARAALDRPAARRIAFGGEQSLSIDEVASLLASEVLVLDACRRGLRAGPELRMLARRPVLFTLARALAEAWPHDVDRVSLISAAFGARRPNESHRARLRVEIGRLRALVGGLARIEATERGFVLQPEMMRDVVVLAPPIDGDQGALLALLSDGAPWSTSALALALDSSQRTIQRALVDLEAAKRVRSIGEARARRWLAAPLAEFTTILLLPGSLQFD